METTKVSLAKCLKLKNRLAGQVSKLESEIQRFNVVNEDDLHKVVNIRESFAQYNELFELITSLKVAIVKANFNLQERLVRLAEIKGRLSFISTINTNESVSKRINQPDIVTVATIKRSEVDDETRKLQVEIDSIQDSVDLYNHETLVDIPKRIIELTT